MSDGTASNISVEPWMEVELNHGKSGFMDPWGRQAIHALDRDDCVRLFEVFDSKIHSVSLVNKKHIDAQATIFGYGEYLWTSQIHKYIGDTLLHMAVRQKKMMCIHMLLILKADYSIRNASGLTADDLCHSVLQASLASLAFESMKYVLNNLEPKQFRRLPRNAIYSSLEEEAWRLLRAGRVLYCELPASMDTGVLSEISATEKKAYLSFGRPPPARSDQDEDGTDAPSVEEGAAALVSRWVRLADESGAEYYYCEATGESSWEMPPDFLPTPLLKASLPPVVVPTVEHVSLASREYQSYLDADAEEDDFAQIEALKARIREMEKIDRLRAKERNAARKHSLDAAAEQQRRRAEYLARQAEMASLKALMSQRILLNKERMRRRAEEERLGRSNTPGAQATGDVWSRGTVSDVVSLILRQKQRRVALSADGDAFVAKGLPLLGSVKMRSAAEQVRRQEGGVEAGERFSLQSVPPEMLGLAGMQKLRFLKAGQVSPAVTRSLQGQLVVPIHAVAAETGSPGRPRVVSTIPDRLLFGSAAADGRSAKVDRPFVYDASAHLHSVEYAASREVTEVSTASNLKYMRVGDAGLTDLAAAMRDDPIIRKICLSCARVSSAGACALAAVLPTMRALTYLDLSCNLLGDEGAAALAEAIATPGCGVEKLILAGNRISLKGAIALVQAAFESRVTWLSLKNNSMSSSGGADRQMLEKLLEERDFAPLSELRRSAGRSGSSTFARRPSQRVTHELLRPARQDQKADESGDENEDSKQSDDGCWGDGRLSAADDTHSGLQIVI